MVPSAGFVPGPPGPCRARQAGVGGGHGRAGAGGLCFRRWACLQETGGLVAPTSAATHLSGWTGPRLRAAPGPGPGVVVKPWCVGGRVPGSGRAGTKGQCPAPPALEGFLGRSSGGLGLRALSGAAV